MQTLANYPHDIVHVACRFCKRRGRYRLETLTAAYGANYDLADLLAHLSRDCGAALERTGKFGCKGPYLPDLEPPRER